MPRQFAKIYADDSRRFGELKKREIQVYIELLTHRNDKTGQCNPRQARIAKEIGMAKSHVSEAIASLKEKRRISEDPERPGHFIFPDILDPKSSQNGNVPESGTQVPESGTQGSQNGKSTYIDEQSSKQSSKQIGSRLPETFELSDEMIAWAKENTPGISYTIETEQFRDYWKAATKNATKRDWTAAWYFWMRNAVKYAAKNGNTPAAWQNVGRNNNPGIEADNLKPVCIRCNGHDVWDPEYRKGATPGSHDDYHFTREVPCPDCTESTIGDQTQ